MHIRRWAIRPILLAVTVVGCGTASGTTEDAAASAVTTAQSTTARVTTGLPTQEPTTVPTRQRPSSTAEAPTAGVTDPAARVRAAARATAHQPWLAMTVSVPSQQPVTMIYENGDLVGCSGWPNYAASYTFPTLVDALEAVTAVEVNGDLYDLTGPPHVIPFYDVRSDEEGRLVGATWYAGEVATFYTFSYDHSRVSSCPGTTLP